MGLLDSESGGGFWFVCRGVTDRVATTLHWQRKKQWCGRCEKKRKMKKWKKMTSDKLWASGSDANLRRTIRGRRFFARKKGVPTVSAGIHWWRPRKWPWPDTARFESSGHRCHRCDHRKRSRFAKNCSFSWNAKASRDPVQGWMWWHSLMTFHVKSKMIGSRKASFAVIALEWLAARVLSIMAGEFVRSSESPFTARPRTFVRLLACRATKKSEKTIEHD